MPPYFSIEFSFNSKEIYPNFVNDIYSVFFNNNFTFKHSYDKDNSSIDQIIKWNQRKLEKEVMHEFTPLTEESYYKQIILENDLFQEVRLFWMFLRREIRLILITPENEVLDNNERFIPSKIEPFLHISKKVWELTNVSAIQTSLECDGGTAMLYKLQNRQEQLWVRAFVIVNESMIDVPHNYDMYKIERNGVVLVNKF
ncbi:hypothetical protein AALF16_03085 [Bacillus cereus]|uniref:hypothetical protein n=1 Tax=Bacillus cereus TaxID=1396 RepID=UPI00356FE08A